MGYRGLGRGQVSAVCDNCDTRSGSREKAELESKGWEFITTKFHLYAYCPDCAEELDDDEKIEEEVDYNVLG